MPAIVAGLRVEAQARHIGVINHMADLIEQGDLG